ncbi:MAG: LptA/OstA family protein [Vulcanimicrobiota bacterium]
MKMHNNKINISAQPSGDACWPSMFFIFLILFFLLTSPPLFLRAEEVKQLPDDAQIRAQRIKYDKNKVQAWGDVHILHKGATLQADQIDYDEETKIVKAEGNVRITQAGETVFGESLIYHTDAERAILWNGYGSTSRMEMSGKKMTGRLYFWGTKIIKEKEYIKIEKGHFTTCDLPKGAQHYNFAVKEAVIYPEDRLVAKHVGVYLHNKLMMNRPLVVLSLKKKDEKQNLFPSLGYSEMDGYYLKEKLPLQMKKEDTGSVALDVYQKTGIGAGLDYSHQIGQSGRYNMHWYQLSPRYDAVMQNDLSKTVSTQRVGKQEFSNFLNYAFPGNLNVGFGYSTYKYAYPQTGDVSWNNNNFYISKGGQKYNYIYSQGSTTYQNFTNTNKNLDYYYRLNNNMRFHMGSFVTTYQGSNFSTRSLWQFNSDIFAQGDYLDTMLSYKNTKGDSVFFFDKLPELTFISKKFSLFDVPFNAALSMGQYHEEPTHVNMGRSNFQISTKNLTWPVGEKGRFDLGCGFRQMNYEDKGAKYVVTTGAGFYQDLGFIGAHFNYFYQRPEGYSPFLTDFVGKYNLVTGGIDLFNKKKYSLSFFTGYDFNTNSYHNMIGRLSLRPTKYTHFDFGSSCDMQTGRLTSVNSQIKLNLGDGLSLDHWIFYDITHQKYTYMDYCLTKETHDFFSRLVYRSEQREFWVQFALKTFPYESVPIGAGPEKLIMPNKFR